MYLCRRTYFVFKRRPKQGILETSTFSLLLIRYIFHGFHTQPLPLKVPLFDGILWDDEEGSTMLYFKTVAISAQGPCWLG